MAGAVWQVKKQVHRATQSVRVSQDFKRAAGAQTASESECTEDGKARSSGRRRELLRGSSRADAPPPVHCLAALHKVLVKQLAFDHLQASSRGGMSGAFAGGPCGADGPALHRRPTSPPWRARSGAAVQHSQQGHACAWPSGPVAQPAHLVHLMERIFQHVIAVQLIHPAQREGGRQGGRQARPGRDGASWRPGQR